LTILKPRSMLVFLWPIVLLHPHSVVRELLPFQRMGLQNWYLMLCLVVIAADPRRVRQGFAASAPVVRRTLFLLLLVGFAHLHAVFVLWLRYPSRVGVGWEKVIEQFVSDLRYLVPYLAALAYVRNRSDMVIAVRSFAIALFAAFSLVIADRFTPVVFALFNRTVYASTWQMHIERAVGGFAGPWEVGGVGVLGIVFATVAAVSRRVLGRSTAVALLVVTAVGVVFAGSRAGFVGAALGILGVLLVARGGAKWRVLVVLAVAAGALLFLQVQDPGGRTISLPSLVEKGIDRAYDDGEFRGSAAIRTRIWRDHLDFLSGGNLEWSQILAGLGGLEGVGVVFQSTGHSGYLAPYLYYGLPLALLLHITLFAVVLASARGRVWSEHPEIFVMWVTVLGGMVTNEFLLSPLTSAVLAFLIVVTSVSIPGEAARAPPTGGPPRAVAPAFPNLPRPPGIRAPDVGAPT
jgi:hypothetical protein